MSRRPGLRCIEVTPAEQRVLLELCRDGADNPEIAERLHITTDTVKSHIKHVLKRTGTVNRTELALDLVKKRLQTRVVRQLLVPGGRLQRSQVAVCEIPACGCSGNAHA